MFVPDSEDAVKVYEQKNAIKKVATLGSYFIDSEKYKALVGFTVEPADIIVSCAGTIGETFVMPPNCRVGVINQALMRIRMFDNQITAYYLIYFDYVLKEQARLHSKGSAIKNIPPFEILKALLIPIPPLNEQFKVSEIIKEIQKYLDEYDALENEREQLDAELPERLRKSILQMAVQGKLVAQDPNDEPASELLERIREERRKLTANGKMKAPKGGESVIYRGSDGGYYEKRIDAKGNESDPVCIDDEIPFEIPASWEWCRLEAVATLSAGTTPSSKQLSNAGVVPYFKVADMNLPGNEKEMNAAEQYINEFYSGKTFPAGTIIYPKNGGAVLTNKRRVLTKESVVDLNTGTCTPFLLNMLNYLRVYFDTIDFGKDYKGTAVPTVNAGMVKQYLLPLPSLDEQARILKTLKQLNY